MRKISDVLGYQAIDIHSHLDHGVPGDSTDWADQNQRYTQNKKLDFLKEEYENVGICCGAFSSFSSVLRDDRIATENDHVYAIAQEKDWVYQWVVIHPEQEQTLLQAQKMLSANQVLGIKIHPQYHKYSILEHGDKIFSFADKLGAVVLMHPAEIRAMPAFADRYPNMKLIIAHLASDEYIHAVAGAKHGNIYIDTSGGSSGQNNVIERAVQKLGADRILFGTDTYSCAFQMGRIAWARIGDAEKKAILRDNALKLFPEKIDPKKYGI